VLRRLNLIWIIILLLLPSAFADLNLSANNLLIWWKPNASILTENSSYARTLTEVSGTTSITTNKLIGTRSGYMTGVYDTLTFSTGNEFRNVHNWTYSIWLNQTSLQSNGGLTAWTEACADDWRVGGFMIQYITAANRFNFNFVASDTVATQLQYALPSTLNGWEMFTFQINETNGVAYMYVYRNATVVASTSVAYTWASNGVTKFRFGSSCQTSSERWVGGSDEWSFWNKSTSGLVNNIYNLGKDGNELDYITPTPPETTPANLISCNLTTEGGEGQIINMTDPNCNNAGCHVPRTNSTTPTIRCTTDEAANMNIIDNNRNLNYSDIYAGNANSGNGTGQVLVATLNTSNQSRIGLFNFSLSLKDVVGNENRTANLFFPINITDFTPPNSTDRAPNSSVFFMLGINSSIDFNVTATDNYDRNFTAQLYIDNVLQKTNNTYLNGTLLKYTVSVTTIGAHTWYYNFTDSFNNVNQSEIRSFDLFAIANISCVLNNTHSNKSFEQYLTLINKPYAINFTCSVQPNVTICIDFDYLVNWTCLTGNGTIFMNISELNNTKFMNGNFSINISSSPYNVSIQQDNNTDLIRMAFKIQGFNPYPSNIFLTYDNQNLFVIPGKLKESEAEYNEFSYTSTKYNATNLTIVSGGTAIIRVNTSNSFSMRNFTSSLSGYDLDGNNEYSKEELFTSSFVINDSLSYQTAAPLGTFDNFENNVSGRWELETVTDINCAVKELIYTKGNLDDSLNLRTTVPSTDTSNCNLRTTYTDAIADLRNTKIAESIFEYSVSVSSCPAACGTSGSASAVVYAFDGTNRVALGTFSVSTSDTSAQSQNEVAKLSLSSISSSSVVVSTNATGMTGGGTVSLTSLNFNNQIKLQFAVTASTSDMGAGNARSAGAYIYQSSLKWGGGWLNNSLTNGTYWTNGNITQCGINVSATNISKITLSWNEYKPTGTNILGYVSNTCNSSTPTWESTTNGILHTYSSVGNNVGVRFNLNGTNVSSPVVRNFETEVIKSSIQNVSLDCDNDGVVDWSYSGILNSTTSPKTANCTSFVSCSSGITCLRPLAFSSSTGGILSVNNISATQSLNELTITNLTPFESITFINVSTEFINASPSGKLRVYDLIVGFNGSANRTFFAHTAENSSLLLGTDNLTAFIYFSKFKSQFPKGVSYFEPLALSNNQSNIPIYGQTIRNCNTFTNAKCAVASTPIYNISSYAYDLPFDMYVNTNFSYNKTCFNFSFDMGVNRTTPMQTNLTPQLLVRSVEKTLVNVNNSRRVFGFVDYYAVTNACANETQTMDFEWRGYCVNSSVGDCVR